MFVGKCNSGGDISSRTERKESGGRIENPSRKSSQNLKRGGAEHKTEKK